MNFALSLLLFRTFKDDFAAAKDHFAAIFEVAVAELLLFAAMPELFAAITKLFAAKFLLSPSGVILFPPIKDHFAAVHGTQGTGYRVQDTGNGF